ncbi:hypothetical protein T4A_9342 [Trichinella pseudospiralis]|uniref:Uncharacterized protein n=1 Tax=Trichinella pseudospiralis TaxID=6337 RepID=A0A0V1F8P6_TRIPS|nr:hypothetical protein T4A_9342 [Trichinella pseudospiralis]KRY82506.1 hypothetical protein T4D_9138 [Trichinella pseudospiralis]
MVEIKAQMTTLDYFAPLIQRVFCGVVLERKMSKPSLLSDDHGHTEWIKAKKEDSEGFSLHRK